MVFQRIDKCTIGICGIPSRSGALASSYNTGICPLLIRPLD